jgi:spore coat polysaccharide biosynthesis protein SpsF (cytidylyltransferase family)
MVLKLHSSREIAIIMSGLFKFLSLCTVLFLFACDNSSNTREQKQSSKKTATLPADSMSKEALFSFVDGCIGDFKLALGEQKAFAFCKCMYDQVRNDNPDIDSVKLKTLVNDSAQVNKMAANCR